jgi:hypothetical protein
LSLSAGQLIPPAEISKPSHFFKTATCRYGSFELLAQPLSLASDTKPHRSALSRGAAKMTIAASGAPTAGRKWVSEARAMLMLAWPMVLTNLGPTAMTATDVMMMGRLGPDVLAGVWLDRFSIIVAGVQRDYLPSMWRSYTPTGEESLILFGSLGLFATMVLLFVRYLPVISMFEHRHARQEGA